MPPLKVIGPGGEVGGPVAACVGDPADGGVDVHVLDFRTFEATRPSDGRDARDTPSAWALRCEISACAGRCVI